MSEQNVTDPQTSKPQRVLACVLCQQRKVKCDRNFPCSNCIKAKVQCVPATQLPRRRRRRFAERELLDQLRKYEELLHQHGIKFEPLQKDSSKKTSPETDRGDDPDEDQPGVTESTSPSASVKIESISGVKSFWHAVRNRFGSDSDSDSEGERDGMNGSLTRALNHDAWSDGGILLGLSDIPVDLSTLHPEPAQILRLWQLFLDNVNPLLRVVHAPTVQGYIIEAIGNIKNMKPAVEALIFGIYSMAIFSLSDEDCPLFFGASRAELLTKYQFGCQQALATSRFLQTTDRDCLTALCLYAVSFAHNTDPRAISSVLAIAIRIAQRMKIDRESGCAEHDVFEAEMRRRLWWALVLYDLRICQIAGEKTKTLMPTFDCQILLNVSDAELRPEMKEAPTTHEEPTESIYAVVKVEMANYMRHTAYNLAFNAPELAPLLGARTITIREDGELMELERMLEKKYLRFCNPEVPLQYVTMWEARALVAKCRLMEDYLLRVDSSPTDVDKLGPSVLHAIRLLDCDTKLMKSPLTKGFRWMMYFNFPLPGYIHLIKYLKRVPLSDHAERAWQVMSDNFVAWDFRSWSRNASFILVMHKMILAAWSQRETAFIQAGEMILPPPMIPKIKESIRLEKKSSDLQASNFNWPDEGSASGGMGPAAMNNLPMGFGSFDAFAGFGSESFNYIPTQTPLDPNLSSLNWAASTMDWGVGQRPNW